MNPTLQLILGILTLISVIGAFLYWHFKTVNAFKDDVHKLQMKLKDLEHRDELQQQTIDQLNKLYPLFEKVFNNLNRKEIEQSN